MPATIVQGLGEEFVITCQSGHSQALIRLGRKDDQTALLDLRDGRMKTQNSYLRLVWSSREGICTHTHISKSIMEFRDDP